MQCDQKKYTSSPGNLQQTPDLASPFPIALLGELQALFRQCFARSVQRLKLS